MEMHNGSWNKVSASCNEVRGKTLGIIGYGHIGSQLSILAESLGMKVCFFDIAPMMAMGSAKKLHSLDDLLQQSDFVTLHVPETNETKNMITKIELSKMKQSACLINASRGTVVNVQDLVFALKSKNLSGCAIDVFPMEPAVNGVFSTILAGCPNTILTPHIGGSTEEAQDAIGIEVSTVIMEYLNSGSTIGSINLPMLKLQKTLKFSGSNYFLQEGMVIRVSNVHLNIPGFLKEINLLLSKFNIEKLSSEARGDVAYFLADITVEPNSKLEDIQHQISSVKGNILTRIL